MLLRLPPLSPRKRGESSLPVHGEDYGGGVFHLFLNTLNCYLIDYVKPKRRPWLALSNSPSHLASM